MDRDQLQRYFDKAVAAAQPDRAVAHHLPQRPKGRTIVVGAGTSGTHAARAVASGRRRWPVDTRVVSSAAGLGIHSP